MIPDQNGNSPVLINKRVSKENDIFIQDHSKEI